MPGIEPATSWLVVRLTDLSANETISSSSSGSSSSRSISNGS